MDAIRYFTGQPKKLLLLDAMGAFVSIFVTRVVLVHFQAYFGIPLSALYLLATVPVFFVVFDLYSVLFPRVDAAWALRIIALLNVGYCCLTVAVACWHFTTYTGLAWLYLILEIAIILGLARLEWSVAKQLPRTARG
ncbi:hypothetical protein [Lewinella sp. 4G2]|uniref:hypothetical protein n=1 Tax=Lewinella sp. 4G2 TaxID=1803372 RepID=UPI0007B49511|nr:hypothetical protein [Lewinella sp. 4G2]OAV44601.1 hypothetical protein A3850_008900 [Lewinella sp. 4G2]